MEVECREWKTGNLDAKIVKAAEALRNVACRDLQVARPELHWYSIGHAELTSRGYNAGESWGGYYVPGGRGIWLRVGLPLADLCRIVPHECRHRWQWEKFGGDMAPRSAADKRAWREEDAGVYGNSFIERMVG